MKVYMVLFDWSTTDDEAIEVELFDTYEKAYTRFTEIIADEKMPDMSWAADAFNEDGTEKVGIVSEQTSKARNRVYEYSAYIAILKSGT